MPFEELGEIHITSLAGLGASYRITGFFTVASKDEKKIKVNFKGVAFGGHYGGHNVNVQISAAAKKTIMQARSCQEKELEDLLVEIQRRILNGEMVVEFEKIKPEEHDALGNVIA